MKIEQGWRFNTADFSVGASSEAPQYGCITLIRDPREAAAWHKMPDELKDSDDGPPLFVVGRGLNFEDALISANLAASHAKPIPAEQEGGE